jgi:hypothetical protein
MATKVTVNLPDGTVSTLRDIAQDRGITLTEALRQTIESQRYLDQEIRRGGKVLVEKPDQTLRQIVFNIPQKDREG